MYGHWFSSRVIVFKSIALENSENYVERVMTWIEEAKKSVTYVQNYIKLLKESYNLKYVCAICPYLLRFTLIT